MEERKRLIGPGSHALAAALLAQAIFFGLWGWDRFDSPWNFAVALFLWLDGAPAILWMVHPHTREVFARRGVSPMGAAFERLGLGRLRPSTWVVPWHSVFHYPLALHFFGALDWTRVGLAVIVFLAVPVLTQRTFSRHVTPVLVVAFAIPVLVGTSFLEVEGLPWFAGAYVIKALVVLNLVLAGAFRSPS